MVISRVRGRGTGQSDSAGREGQIITCTGSATRVQSFQPTTTSLGDISAIKEKGGCVAERPSSPPIGCFLDLLTRGALQFVEIHAPKLYTGVFCFWRGPTWSESSLKRSQRRQKGKQGGRVGVLFVRRVYSDVGKVSAGTTPSWPRKSNPNLQPNFFIKSKSPQPSFNLYTSHVGSTRCKLGPALLPNSFVLVLSVTCRSLHPFSIFLPSFCRLRALCQYPYGSSKFFLQG